jgi:hypothetical protein
MDIGMSDKIKSDKFNKKQIKIVNKAAEMAEELVSDYYKLSSSQWLRRRYDIKTLADLSPEEIVSGPFAQIIRYKARPKESSLGSSAYDFYKICLQDNSILDVISDFSTIKLCPFTLYIITHELIHIVRFSEFLQNFNATNEEKLAEETRVHNSTHDILKSVKIPGLPTVLKYYNKWRVPVEKYDESLLHEN